MLLVAASYASIKFGSIDPAQLVSTKTEDASNESSKSRQSFAAAASGEPNPEEHQISAQGKGSNGRMPVHHHNVPNNLGISGRPYQGAPHQYPMPYGQPYQAIGQVQSQYPPYIQAPFYPGSFGNQMGAYYGSPIMSQPISSQDPVSPSLNQRTPFSPPTARPAVPVRQKKVCF